MSRSFLLTVHEPGSAVLEDLRTGRSVRILALADAGGVVAGWLAEEPPAGPDPGHPGAAHPVDHTGRPARTRS